MNGRSKYDQSTDLDIVSKNGLQVFKAGTRTKMVSFPRVILGIDAAIFTLTGMSLLLAPRLFFQFLISPATAAALGSPAETPASAFFRKQFGAFALTVGLLCAAGWSMPAPERTKVLALLWVCHSIIVSNTWGELNGAAGDTFLSTTGARPNPQPALVWTHTLNVEPSVGW